jgi:SAM-dependent methyltransferase
VPFDATGKVTLDHIYTQPDPRAYFRELRPLGYCVPQQAKPYFAKLVKEYRETAQVQVPTVLDIGCGYGINAALLKYDAGMDELYERYAGYGEGDDPAVRAAMLDHDRRLARSRQPAHGIRVVGLDTSAAALAYAREAGFLDDAVHADLESGAPTKEQSDRLAGADLVISTGCIGYVTERTLRRVVAAQGGRLPWMAHFVLRMIPFDPVEHALSELGYTTTRLGELFPQRRFASATEQSLVLETMSANGVDTRGLETEGWMYAQLYLSRPHGQESTTSPDDPEQERN